MSLIGTGFSQTVTIARVYRLAVPMNAAYSWLRGQRPAGAVLSAYGSGGIRGRVTMDQVNFRVNTPPSWLYSVSLYTAVRAAGTGSLLLAEAQVQWYPARSPADYIDPARYVSVTVSRLVNNHATSRTFGADSVRRLAAMVNALHAMPDIAIGCPAMGPSIPAYQLRFNPAGTAPAVVVDPTRCFAVDVTVGGHRVQPLFPASPLMTVAQRILRTTARG